MQSRATGIALDLTAIGDTKISGVEEINLSGTGANTLTVSASDVAAMSDTGTLTVRSADANDFVTSPDTWFNEGIIELSGNNFRKFTLDGKTLLVKANIDISGLPQVPLAEINLGSLDGLNGFELIGEEAVDRSGTDVTSAGDVNGDGLDDLFIGARTQDADGSDSGAAYVVFATTSPASSVNLDDVALGTGGFKISGETAGDEAGVSVSSVGDVNGDGLGDLLVGANLNDAGGTDAGAAYVIFGTTSSVMAVNLDDIALGTGGFKITGEALDNYAGISVESAGDVNGDGIGDLLVGADGNDAGGEGAGAAYVIFGTTTSITALNLDDVAAGTGGFRIIGEEGYDQAGHAVAALGDVNGDGFDDVFVGAYRDDGGGNDYPSSGATYVIFGSATPQTSVNLDAVALGTGGFKIAGENTGDTSGYAASSAGDVNGDGIADMLVGAHFNDQGGSDAGAAYVIFGTTASVSAVDLSDVALGTGGFKITGEAAGDEAGIAVSAAGDVNGDGVDDFLVGAEFESAGGGSAGAAYLIFGTTAAVTAVDLDDVALGTGGFKLIGAVADDRAGSAVGSAGDVNGDGFADIFVGAKFNDEGGSRAGTSYVFFGSDFTADVDVLGTSAADSLFGTAAVDVIVAGRGGDTVFGNGGEDVIRGGAGDDAFHIFGELGDIDGGSGSDTIVIDGGNLTLDLTAIGDTKVTNIETVDLTGVGDNSITLSVNEVNAETENGTLTIIGDAGDTFVTTDTWEFFGAENVGGQTFQRFESQIGETTLLVDLDVDTSGLSSQQIFSESVIDFPGGDFKITGELAGDQAGYSVSSAGDVNGDEIDDVLVGAIGNDAGGTDAGLAYVVFGTTSSVSAVNLADTVLGTGGFRITGEEAGDLAGISVSSAGDVNGDGVDDLLVGAYVNDAGGTDAGAAYVVFGTTSSVSAVDLADVALGTSGFRITGEVAGDKAGLQVSSAGDVNGDGIDDLVVGSRLNDSGGTDSGAAYVIFGTASSVSAVNLADVALGTGGFKITGEAVGDYAGESVSSAGDVNGDGIDDLLVGARLNDNGGDNAGAAYVIFGTTSSTSAVDLDDVALGTGGFKITGEVAFDGAGFSVSSAGDVNGDGIGDVLFGAYRHDAGGTDAGAAYVIFGTTSSVSAVNLDAVALGTGGFKITGEVAGDYAGFSASSAGDVNGDGIDDMLVSARLNDAGGGDGGAAYLIFGTTSSVTAVNLDDVALGTGGFRVTGEVAGDYAGESVSSAGDVNGDGFDDLLVGAKFNGAGGTNAGAAYVLFGFDITGDVTELGSAGDDTLTGSAGADVMIGGAGDDIMNGLGGADVLRGGAGNDDIAVSDLSFTRIAGGLGDDVLDLQGSALSFDLTATSDTKITGIEEIDLTGTGNNSVTLSANDVAAISDTGVLRVFGDTGDAVVTTDTWTSFCITEFEGDPFRIFELDGKTLLIGFDVDVSGVLSQQISTESLGDIGDGGFKIIGETVDDRAGSSVSSAGDVNGDGIDDFLVGALRNDAGGSDAGAAYVVFGTTASVSSVNLDDIAGGTDGFKITGETGGDNAGFSVSTAGDVDGDGIDDLIVGANRNAEGGSSAGAAYLVFGTTSSVSAVNLDDIASGTGGFKITSEAGGDQTGYAVSFAGDFNGDGIDDFLVGSPQNDGGGVIAGAAYLIFGTTSSVSAVSLSDVAGGTGGFKITGEVAGDQAGLVVSSAGDVNGDGIDDLFVGARLNDAGGADAGAGHVIFGTTSNVLAVNLNDVASGTGGFKITGEFDGDQASFSVSSAGDVNGDGIDDLIIGARNNDGGGTDTGAGYVIFGTTSSVSAVNLDDVALGTGGFKIIGEALTDYAGASVSSAGDVNGDGLDDILIGALRNDAAGSQAGAAYVVFGTTSSVSAVNLDDVALGTGGFRVTGETADDFAGQIVSSAGDVNGDGFDDLLVTAKTNDEGGSNAGAAYVVFGNDFTSSVTAAGTSLDDMLQGTGGADVMIGGAGDDFMDGTGGADVLRGGAGSDDLRVTDASFVRIDGGRGNDFLQAAGGINLDLTAIGDARITGIEAVEFTAAGSATLTVAASDVRAMSDTGTLSVSVDTDDTLSVADDTVALAGDWTFAGSSTGGSLSVHQFTNGATLLDAEITTLTNAGTLNVVADRTLEFTNAADILSNSQNMLFSGSSTLTVDTGTLHNLAGGTISGGFGNTIVTANGGVFQNDGTLNFGESPGAFAVDGDLGFGNTASMLVELGGLEAGVHDGFDQLTVTDAFGAGGTMNVVEFGGFEVSAGDSFAVVDTGAISGSFDDITGLDVGGGVVLDATQGASGVTLTGRAVTHQGTAADDILTGGSGDDVFVGGGGSDFVLGGGGANLMHGGAGDDVFVAADTSFGRIDGGDGFDTVRFDGAGQSFDLGGLRGDQVNAIESFDLTGNGGNTLTLDADMVFSATRGTNAETGTGHSLIIDGDTGDVVDAGEGWSNTGTVTIGGDGYSVFESASNGARIFVDDDVAVTTV